MVTLPGVEFERRIGDSQLVFDATLQNRPARVNDPRDTGPEARRSRLMSIDQRVACRRAPTLPGDLPRAGDWKTSMFEGNPVYTLSGRGWLVNVVVESGITDEEMQETFADDLADAGADGDPDDYGVMTYVSLEPAGAPQDGVDLMMAVLEMLAKTCDGVVLAN
jgi:hypothetical protein